MKTRQAVKRHYKMYKSGRNWVVGSLTVIGVVMVLGTVNAQAATPTTDAGTNQTAKTVDESEATETGAIQTPAVSEATAQQLATTTSSDSTGTTSAIATHKTTIHVKYFAVDQNGQQYYTYQDAQGAHYTKDKQEASLHNGVAYELGSQPDVTVDAGKSYQITSPDKLPVQPNGSIQNDYYKRYGSSVDDEALKRDVVAVEGMATNVDTERNVAFYYLRSQTNTVNYVGGQGKPLAPSVNTPLSDDQDVMLGLTNPVYVPGYTVDWDKSTWTLSEEGQDPKTESLTALMDELRVTAGFTGTTAEVYTQWIKSGFLGTVSPEQKTTGIKVDFVYNQDPAVPVTVTATLSGTDSKVEDGKHIDLRASQYHLSMSDGTIFTLQDSDLELVMSNATHPGTYKVQLSASGLARLRAAFPNETVLFDNDGSSATFVITAPAEKVTVTVVYKDKDGKTIKYPTTIDGKKGDRYRIKVPTIKGYAYVKANTALTGTFGDDATVTLTYQKKTIDHNGGGQKPHHPSQSGQQRGGGTFVSEALSYQTTSDSTTGPKAQQLPQTNENQTKSVVGLIGLISGLLGLVGISWRRKK